MGEERAIVSDIHGTTRDVIEDTIQLGGATFRFIDTAGIRQTTDTIESLGIKRSFQAIRKAEIVLWVIDQKEAEKQIATLSKQIIPLCNDKQLILVLNKSDIADTPISIANYQLPTENTVSLSAKSRDGLDRLQNLLIKTACLPRLSSGDVIVTNARHYEALSHSLQTIRRVQQGLSTGISSDLIVQDLRECLFHLADIVGQVTTDDVLDNIFQHFCIGK